MNAYSNVKVFNFDLPPYPREGIFHLDMSEFCQVNRFLRWQAGRYAQICQLDEIKTLPELKKFQKALRAKIWEKAGVRYDGKLPLDVQKFGTIKKDGYTITKLIYQSRPGIYVTGLLYVPEGKGPFPAVLQMHGHNPEGKFGENPQRMSLALVREGYVCLTVDAFGTYERAHDCYVKQGHGGFLGASLFCIGESLLGAQIVDNMRGVDLLLSLKCVIRDKIGATGASGGGNQTMWLSAMDERITAAMPIVSVGSFASYVYGLNCICELLPDGLTFTEESGILALIAPRALRIGNAQYDCNHDFSVSEMLKTYHPVEKIYWNLGCPEKIAYSVADRIHGLTDRQRQAVLGHFAQFLKGEGNGNARPEPEGIDPLPEEELYLFPDTSKRPDKVRTIQAHCRLTGEKLRKEYLARKTIQRKEALAGLEKLLRLRKLPEETVLHKYAEVKGVTRYALEAGDHLIPFLLKKGTVPGKFRILTHTEGKAFLTDEAIAEAAKDGSTLLLPDLYGTGETAQPNHTICLHHQFYRQLLWIGRSLVGEWVYDLLALVRMLKKEFKAKDIELTGHLETGAAAVFANALCADVRKVETVDSPASLLFDMRTVDFTGKSPFVKFLPGLIYSLVLAIPGFLKWGDISLAAALGKGEVVRTRPRTWDGTLCTKKEASSAAKEVEEVRKKLL
ncbi:MAG: acetylxylan esterase [Lentisphaeria bacterium]|nr:acetylxylan esterase [Lentisphaeria bacterium]